MLSGRRHNQITSELGPAQFVAVSSLTFPRALRCYTSTVVKQAARFVEAFGLRLPILLDAERTVIAGEIWALAARALDLPEVPALFVEGLTADQQTAYRIGLQRLPELGKWDEDALGEVFKDWSGRSLDFNIDITGFSMPEIDDFVGKLKEDGKDGPVEFLPDDPAAIVVSSPGDLWLAGHHKIWCGSSIEGASFDAVMADDRASVVITDPPYNVPVDGHVGGKGRIQHREFAMASGEMSQPDFVAFLESVTRLLSKFSVAGSLHYLFMDWRHAQEILLASSVSYSELKNIIVWVKSNAGMGSLYRSQHELVFLFKNGCAPHRNNVQLGRHGRNRTNVWNYPGATSLDGRMTDEGHLLGMHPTVKPVQMIADALLDSSARRDIVLDPFLGSGSTLIAAERVGRRLRGIEIDPLYVDVAIRRWQRHTGQEAQNSVTGRTFNETLAEKSDRP